MNKPTNDDPRQFREATLDIVTRKADEGAGGQEPEVRASVSSEVPYFRCGLTDSKGRRVDGYEVLGEQHLKSLKGTSPARRDISNGFFRAVREQNS